MKPTDSPKESNGSASSRSGNLQVANSHTRLQATFEAIKKMSSGLSTPRVDFSPKKSGTAQEGKPLGYFDVASDEDS